MPVETMISNTAWPTLNESHGNVIPAVESTNGNTNGNEWEMVADTEEADVLHANTDHIVILPTGDIPKEAKGRPRSATVGGEGAAVSGRSNRVLKESGSFNSSSKGSDPFKVNRRTLRRCASTPDLLVSDNDHEVIVEDESDEEEDEEMDVISSDECDFCEDEDEDSVEDETVEEGVVRLQKTQEGGNGDDSFEVVSAKTNGCETEDIGSEPVMVDEDASMDTSAWTLTSAATGANPVTASVWGGKNTPSFKDILSKNVDKTMSWGNDKAQTEAMLRDSHRRHHLRVRTKPKFVVADDGNHGGKVMKHAHSTGDLTKMMQVAERTHQRAFGRGMKKQFSALVEEEDEKDLIIGNGGGGGSRSGGGGMGAAEVMGDTDAMDYYHQKEKGSQSTINKKKERPDEMKRKEISMYKKELQKEKQQLKSGEGAKKKKNEKGFGGKKERQRW
ncbi:hypothetical protein HJC23_002922 [Cyclotella cryptica]|uniref:Uncharacterized protein n=1 Tax=Cyclotella cryptica TaxID=29204 RepID=A0ABD3PSN1_9STRA|eukprot:CCRYP_012441-RA/>CCRYP_012441-RA protein AED:0.18 eAED:0.18 QI:0/-1/0/1/-1/1/1/0/445